jgi:hypothetical protein
MAYSAPFSEGGKSVSGVDDFFVGGRPKFCAGVYRRFQAVIMQITESVERITRTQTSSE